tara:strand:+ start:1292 stop:2176 length:885 start_codon:yes stop_codon:yes gene_type:complete
MAEDIYVKKYFENLPYGNDAKSSEVHGKRNQLVINEFVANLTKQYDALMASNQSAKAQHMAGAIRNIARQLDSLKNLKSDFATYYGGGVGGKKLFSNYTDLTWDRIFWTEGGFIEFGPGFEILLSCIVPPNNQVVTKRIMDVTENWVIKGDEEMRYMQLHQQLVKEGQTAAKHPSFNIDFTVDNMLINNDAWKIFVSDKIGGIYFLHEYLQTVSEDLAAGNISDEILHPNSFHPEKDTRLHQFYADRLRSAFDPNYMAMRSGNQANSFISGRTKMSSEELPKLEDLQAKMQNQQ